MYLFFFLVTGRGPTISIATFSKGLVMCTAGTCMGALEWVRLAVF